MEFCDQCGDELMPGDKVRMGNLELCKDCARDVKRRGEIDEMELDEKTPPGYEKIVKGLKKNQDVDNPWAVAWSMKNKGIKPKHEGDIKEASRNRTPKPARPTADPEALRHRLGQWLEKIDVFYSSLSALRTRDDMKAAFQVPSSDESFDEELDKIVAALREAGSRLDKLIEASKRPPGI